MDMPKEDSIWSHFYIPPNGYLKPGFHLFDESDIGDFVITSNSAGGKDAKGYAEQLQLLLEGLTLYSKSILLRVEVDSRETSNLDISEFLRVSQKCQNKMRKKMIQLIASKSVICSFPLAAQPSYN